MKSRISIYVLPLLLLTGFTGELQAAADLTLAPREMSHTQEVRQGSDEFTIDVTGQTPPVNLGITIEGPAQNARLTIEGGRDFSSIDALAASLIRPGMSDEEKVRSIFYFVATNMYDRGGNGCDDPLEYANLWGYSWCGNFGLLVNALWKSAGFQTVFLNPVLAMPSGHTITAVFYDNQWHMYDARLRGYFLNHDNRTVASLIELDQDDRLILRGLGFDGRLHHHWPYHTTIHNYMNAASDWYDGFNSHYDNQNLFNTRCPKWDSSLNLHRGETIHYTWKRGGKWWSRKDMCERWLKEHSEGREAMTIEPPLYANGTLTCRLDPRHYKDQPLTLEGVKTSGDAFVPKKGGQNASLVYRIRMPYFIPSLRIQAAGQCMGGALGVEISTDDGASWSPLDAGSTEGAFNIDLTTEETQRVTWYSENKYGCLVRFSFPQGADGQLRDVTLIADLFYRPMILPKLTQGTNRFTWRSDKKGGKKARVTFSWLEDTNVLTDKADPTENEEVEITALVTNKGDTPAENVTVRFFDGDPDDGGRQIGEDVSIASIPAGGTGEATTAWKADQFQTDAGKGVSIGSGIEHVSYLYNTLYAVADPDNGIDETDESNNSSCRPLTVYNMADLVLKDPSFVTFSRSDDDKVTITALIRNQNLYGHIVRAREARNVRVRFYDSQPLYRRMDEHLIGESIIPSIAPGEFGVARCDWDVSGLTGNKLIYVVVDPLDEIQEKWQTRNAYSMVKKRIDLDEGE